MEVLVRKLEVVIKYFTYFSELPRHYFGEFSLTKPDDDVMYQVHIFADAVDDAFGAVVYICSIVNGIVSTFLVFGKSQVALKHEKFFKI